MDKTSSLEKLNMCVLGWCDGGKPRCPDCQEKIENRTCPRLESLKTPEGVLKGLTSISIHLSITDELQKLDKKLQVNHGKDDTI